MQQAQPVEVSLIGIKEVRRISGLSRSEIHRRIRSGKFPVGVRLGPVSVRWSRAEVIEWVEARLGARQQQKAKPSAQSA